MYVRVKDPTSGHEFDRPENDPLIKEGLLKVITSDRWPESDVARPEKHHIPQAPAVQPDQSASSVTPDATDKEKRK